MPRTFSRRNLIGAAALAVSSAATGAAFAAPTLPPSIWEGQKMYETMIKNGTYFTAPGGDSSKVLHVFIDTQCPDCNRLIHRLRPLMSKIEVRFYPISFLGIHSEPQATTILMSKDPWKAFEEHHTHFRDPDFRGIRYGKVEDLPVELRAKVWMNTKLHRRCGCRAVPFGVYKNSKEQYVPVDESQTTKELAQTLEIE